MGKAGAVPPGTQCLVLQNMGLTDQPDSRNDTFVESRSEACHSCFLAPSRRDCHKMLSPGALSRTCPASGSWAINSHKPSGTNRLTACVTGRAVPKWSDDMQSPPGVRECHFLGSP